MKLFSHTRPRQGERMANGEVFWMAEPIEHPDILIAGITLPIPWPFWHYLPEYKDKRFGWWNVTLAVRRDDRPMDRGSPPRIEANSWVSWRGPTLPSITKILNPWHCGIERSSIPFYVSAYYTSRMAAGAARGKRPG